MKYFTAVAVAVLGLAAQQTMALESAEPVQRAAPVEKRDVGCYQQGTSSKPAMCYTPGCPSGTRSVFWDFGCPSSSWKCCI
ncbi:uncharacterized protein N7482_002489 [Penicillium canariense]|uniref:Uncharacterized protein n=1 Tax=Penicillium canariense TaxID=189055 RepID=A0A9W9LV66_9EURO|nr:uncharacterized protein N7482_002489 [Penicillium canariense]KAJ5176612.1 hypothetical protein N7482_002489 [Penicillium canariense]